MDYESFLNLCKERRSIRKYTEQMVSDSDIEKIIMAGIQAPSGTNVQGWKFKILKEKKDITKLATIISDKVNLLASSHGDSIIRNGMLEYGGNFFFFKDAPVVIVLYTKKPTNLSQYFFRDGLNSYKGSGTFLSMGMVIQNMMLASHSLGLGSCILTGPMIAEDEIELVFEPPKKYELCGILSLGYPAVTPKSPGRKELDKFII
ncbi:MAG TPA: nitroreductase family protein [Spirochaetota bacterium]|nr:nitroreductase family protein [Spirochaetota bacterium]